MGLEAAIPFSRLWSTSVLILAQELHHHGWFWPRKCLSLKQVHLCILSFEKVTSLKMAVIREDTLPVLHKPMKLSVLLSTYWEERER